MALTEGWRQVRAAGLAFDANALDSVQPWVVEDRGLLYCGEVVVSRSLQESWVRPLAPDLCFRVVFLIEPRRVATGRLQDPRAALVVPRRGAGERWHTYNQELQAVRETQARYVTSRDPAAAALRGSMREREDDLGRELVERYRRLYLQGRIRTAGGPTLRPGAVFADGGPDRWADRLAVALLRRAYPRLPVDPAGWPGPLGLGEVLAVHRGLICGQREEAALRYGPGLGLSSSGAPGTFDASRCEAVALVSRWVAEAGGGAEADGLLDRLCRQYGVPFYLGALYLLAYVLAARGQAALRTLQGLRDRRGHPWEVPVLPWDLLREVEPSPALYEAIDEVHATAEVSWRAALPYARAISPELTAPRDTDEEAEAWSRLSAGLSALQEQARDVVVALEELAVALTGDASEAGGRLEALVRVAAARDLEAFLLGCRGTFAAPRELETTLDLLRRATALVGQASSLTFIVRYLRGMALSPRERSLALEREALLGRVDLPALLDNPALVGSLEAHFRRLQQAYARLYRHRHDAYHGEAAEVAARLEEARVLAEALDRFNRVPELDGPLAPEVPGRLRELAASLRPCPQRGEAVDLEGGPLCPECRMPLDAPSPRAEAEDLLGRMEGALREYNRRLGSHGVRRALARPARDRLETFIAMIQASDPSPLARVLDDEVVEFLRRFLQEGQEGPT